MQTKVINRNKNLLGNGYCHEAIMEINAEHDAKKKFNEALVKDLIDFNKKLRKGDIVDQGEAIRMIMGGIIALISKKTGIDEHFEAKMMNLEVENTTGKNRLESLES